jgi:glutamate racemase
VITGYKVLFFDSGVGGLSIYNDVMKKCSEFITPIYLFDNDFCPYGDKTDEVVLSRVLAIMKNVMDKIKPDLIVIACNTASTVALEQVRKLVQIPVIGVVPAIKPAAKLSRIKKIGLLATPATILREYTDKLIKQFASDVDVLKIGTTELVDLAEKKVALETYDESIISSVLSPWLELPQPPDVIVLGCTHFPHLKTEISKLFPNSLVIDSGEAIARRLIDLLNTIPPKQSKKQKTIAFCTSNDVKQELEKYLKQMGFDELKLFKI